MKAFCYYCLVGILFPGLINNSFAQSWSIKCYSININDQNLSIKTGVLSTPLSIIANETLSYYWYASNKIIVTKGGYDGKLLHGQYKVFYLSNNIKENGYFNKGLKTGKWINWYEGGKIKEMSCWKNGIQYGEYKTFNEDEQLNMKVNYKEGKLHGVSTTYQEGKIISQRNYKNGIEIISTEEKKSKNSLTEVWQKIIQKVRTLFKHKPVKQNLINIIQ